MPNRKHDKRPLQRLGVVNDLTPRTNLYANISTAFETPTTAEVANPSGGGGLNPELEPQFATNYELGIKGTLAGGHSYELALFHIDVEDELIPFEVAGQPGRNFFANAGGSSRNGIELAISAAFSHSLTGSLGYTYSDFVFDRFTNSDGQAFDGNRIPGIPEHLLQGTLSYQDRGFFADWEILYVDDFFADNANTAKNDSYFVSNLKAGYSWTARDWEGTLFFGVNNLWDEEYISNVRINAFGGRYFEPAPERNWYTGMRLRYLFDL